MYIPDYIQDYLADGFDMGTYSVIATALSRNYGVFHIDYGRDENDIPFGEVGLISPYPIQSIFPKMNWDSYFEPDHELTDGEEEFYRNMKAFYNMKVFPIITTSVTMPEELSRKFVSGFEGAIDEESEEEQQLTFNIHTYVGEPFEMHEVIVRCTYEEKAYKDLKIGSTPLVDADSFETFIMWYLTKWLSLQPRISTEDHLD